MGWRKTCGSLSWLYRFLCGVHVLRAPSVSDVISWENQHATEDWPNINHRGKLPKMMHVYPYGEWSLQEGWWAAGGGFLIFRIKEYKSWVACRSSSAQQVIAMSLTWPSLGHGQARAVWLVQAIGLRAEGTYGTSQPVFKSQHTPSNPFRFTFCSVFFQIEITEQNRSIYILKYMCTSK